MKKILVSLILVLSTYTTVNACDLSKVSTFIEVGRSEGEDENYCDALKLYQRARDILDRDKIECSKTYDKVLIELLDQKLQKIIALTAIGCEIK